MKAEKLITLDDIHALWKKLQDYFDLPHFGIFCDKYRRWGWRII